MKSTLHKMNRLNYPIGHSTCMSRIAISVNSVLEVMIAVNKYLAFSNNGVGMALDLSWKCKRCEMGEWSCIMCTVS